MFCTIGMKRHAHHQRLGLPFVDALFDLNPPCIALGMDRGLRLGAGQEAAAKGHARAFEAIVKRHERRQACWQRQLEGFAAHA